MIKQQYRYGRGKTSLILTIVSSILFFVINDIQKEDSIIKMLFKKIPGMKKMFEQKDNANMEIPDNPDLR